MKAAVLPGKEAVRIQEIAPLPLGAALTCGTDLKVFKRGYHAKMIVPPAVFGHELAGVISELGIRRPGSGMGSRRPRGGGEFRAVRGLFSLSCRPGKSVRGFFVSQRCLRGIHCCAGAARPKNLLQLKPETTFRDDALTEPPACVVQGVEDLKLHAGQNVLVLGAGPIGLMFVALAKNLGCEVTVAGRRAAHVADIGDGTGLVAKIRDDGNKI